MAAASPKIKSLSYNEDKITHLVFRTGHADRLLKMLDRLTSSGSEEFSYMFIKDKEIIHVGNLWGYDDKKGEDIIDPKKNEEESRELSTILKDGEGYICYKSLFGERRFGFSNVSYMTDSLNSLDYCSGIGMENIVSIKHIELHKYKILEIEFDTESG